MFKNKLKQFQKNKKILKFNIKKLNIKKKLL